MTSPAIAVYPASGSITHGSTICRLTVTDSPSNDETAYSVRVYPTSPEISYYIKFSLGGKEKARSYTFSTDADGSHVFSNFMFDAAGTWTVTVHDTSDDSQVSTLSVTVS